MNYKDKTVMVIAHGLFAHVAERLTRDFGRVLLYVPWNSWFGPTMNMGSVGVGIKGVEKVDSIFCKEMNEVDLFVFTDIYFAAEQVYLESIGKRVWGCRNGEELELYRDVCKEIMEEKGLPVNKWKKLVGIKALREHLKAHENQFVKFDKWRGNFETFKSESYELSEVKIDEIAHQLGAFQHAAEFIVEDEIPDCVEIGIDIFTIDGEYPKKTAVGIEAKDAGYVCEFMDWDKIPEPIRRWHEVMAPIFAEYGYRGWTGNEVRITKDGHEPFMIDATCRQPCPPGELLTEYYTNYADILWFGADGVIVQPIAAAKFGVEVIMKSTWAEDNSQPVEFDPKFADQIKLFNCCEIDGKRWVIPQEDRNELMGAVIGWGDTMEEAVAHMKKAADTVKGFGITIPSGALDKVQEAMQELADAGLPVFTLEKPKTTE